MSSTLPTCSLTYCCVRAAQGVKEALQKPCQHISTSCPTVAQLAGRHCGKKHTRCSFRTLRSFRGCPWRIIMRVMSLRALFASSGWAASSSLLLLLLLSTSSSWSGCSCDFHVSPLPAPVRAAHHPCILACFGRHLQRSTCAATEPATPQLHPNTLSRYAQLAQLSYAQGFYFILLNFSFACRL